MIVCFLQIHVLQFCTFTIFEILDQTHHRLREATGRKRAEDLNERVMIWSMGQTAVFIVISIGQVIN